MKFLIVTEGRDPIPPEMALPMLDMMDGWLAEHRGSGKLVDVWSFAGRAGGGGIVDVDSHEELDAIMVGFPFNATSSVSVYALADLDSALANSRKTFEMIASRG
jgi:muconolactone delta-isomerase